MAPEETGTGRGRPNNAEAGSQAPSITLPKGGGAIRGIGTKFAADPVTCTGSMTVTIAASPGRSGFGPQLSLSYDPSSGNSPFRFGWSLSLPTIARKTDKRLPQYRDAEESDVFLLSGAQDLLPVFKKEPNGDRELDADARHVSDEEPRDGRLGSEGKAVGCSDGWRCPAADGKGNSIIIRLPARPRVPPAGRAGIRSPPPTLPRRCQPG